MQAWMRRLIWLVLFLALLVIVTFLVYFFILTNAGKILAKSVSPPDYPNSRLLEQWMNGGWDRRTYVTQDDLSSVLDYMETFMPGFTSGEEQSTGQYYYENERCEGGWLARHIGSVSTPGQAELSLPCAYVRLFTDPNDLEKTRIHLWLSWPSP